MVNPNGGSTDNGGNAGGNGANPGGASSNIERIKKQLADERKQRTGSMVTNILHIDLTNEGKQKLKENLVYDSIAQYDAKVAEIKAQKAAETSGKWYGKVDKVISRIPILAQGFGLIKGIKNLPGVIAETARRNNIVSQYSKIVDSVLENGNTDLDGDIYSYASIATQQYTDKMLNNQAPNNNKVTGAVKNFFGITDGPKALDKKEISEITNADNLKNEFNAHEDEYNRQNRDALFSRVSEAVDADDHNFDTGVKITETRENGNEEHDEKLRGKIRDFATQVAIITNSTNKEAGGSRSRMLTNAKQDFVKSLKELDDKMSIGNYQDIVNTIVSDVTNKSFKNAYKESKSDALRALMDFETSNIKETRATVETGLDVRKNYMKLSDKAILNRGLVLGTSVSLLGTAVGWVKSGILKQVVEGQGLGMMGVKAGVAAAIGAVTGAHRAKKNQEKSLSDAGYEYVENNGNSNDEKNKLKTGNIEEYVSAMKEFTDLINQGDLAGVREGGAFLAEIRARIDFQNEKKLQLFSYGKEGITETRGEVVADLEARKVEFYKTVNALNKAINNYVEANGLKDEYDAEHKQAQNRAKAELMEKYKGTKQEWRKERIKTAALSAYNAATTAALMHYVFHFKDVNKDIRDIFNKGDSAMEAGVVGGTLATRGDKDGGKAEAGEAGTQENAGAETTNAEATNAETGREGANTDNGLGEKSADYEKLRASQGRILIKDDPETGKIDIYADLDGDGTCDLEEKILDDQDLTTVEGRAALSNKLAEGHYGLKSEELEGYYASSEVNVDEYVKNSENYVNIDHTEFDSSAHVSIHTDVTPESVSGAEGIQSYTYTVTGEVPENAEFVFDYDGDGKGAMLKFPITDGKVEIPASLHGLGRFRIGVEDGGTFTSFATESGDILDASDTVTASIETPGYAFTITDMETGEYTSQFAVTGGNGAIETLDRVFNNIDNRKPYFVQQTGDKNQLANGEEYREIKVTGTKYEGKFDPSRDNVFKTGHNASLMSTKMEGIYEADGSLNEVAYCEQMQLLVATNLPVAVEIADALGEMTKENMAEAGITQEILASWGITDGVVDTTKEMSILASKLAEPENGALYVNFTNMVLGKMNDKFENATFVRDTIYSRNSEYLKSDGSIAVTSSSHSPREVIYIRQDGESIFKNGVSDLNDSESGFMTNCGQIGEKIEKGTDEGTDPTPVVTEEDPTPVVTEEDPTPVVTDEDPTPVVTDEDPTPVVTGEDPTPDVTDEDPTPTKVTGEGTDPVKTTGEKSTDEDTTTTLVGKGQNTNAGENEIKLEAETPDPDANYVEATPDNYSSPSEGEVAGAPINEITSDETYTDNAVLDEDGEVMRDDAGNMYIRDPDSPETSEEIQQNIADDTQTTFSSNPEDIATYDPDAESEAINGSMSIDVTDNGEAVIGGSIIPDEVLANFTPEAPDPINALEGQDLLSPEQINDLWNKFSQMN